MLQNYMVNSTDERLIKTNKFSSLILEQQNALSCILSQIIALKKQALNIQDNLSTIHNRLQKEIMV